MGLDRERRGAVEVLTLNRPEVANALDPALLVDLREAFSEIDADPETRAVVLTGAGDRAFCAGMDLSSLGGRDGGGDGNRRRGAAGGSEKTWGDADGAALFRDGLATPLVAAVNGAAVGGGFELVLTADLVVAAEHARFGLPEVKRGLVAGGGGTLLGLRIPLPLALEVALTGEPVPAARAAEWGLVNRVVPEDELLATALQLAERIAANGPLATAATKRLVRGAVTRGPAEGWLSSDDVATIYQSEDAAEGARAFVERRPPVWKGR